ncbi:MAG: diaminobutyrate--2-oxoglutarate transaminase [Polyangiaceae bacterium]
MQNMEFESVQGLENAGLRQKYSARRVPYEWQESQILTRQRQRESNARSYPRRIPLALRRGKGIYVEDVEGRVFIDCLAAAGTLALGHNHPVVTEALRRALDCEVPLQTLDIMTPAKDELVSQLFAMLPREFARHARIQFCGPTGTDAVEAALKLVRTATGRKGLFAFQGAYHGMSQGSLALMGNLGPKTPLDGVLELPQFMPFPYEYRCPFGLGGAAGEAAGLSFIESALSDPEGGAPLPAGIILEPVQGEAGVIPASTSWLVKLRELATRAQVPLILDEVQTGLGRTGRYFAFERAGIVPDVLILSKAIGGGLPLSVVVYHESLDVWQPGAHAGTFRGNQLAMAAGLATLRYIEGERLDRHAEAMGQRFREHLAEVQRQCAIVGDVRGAGLMLGIELVAPEAGASGRPPRPNREAALAVQHGCLRRGLIVELGGRMGATVRLLPPLIIGPDEVDVVAGILRAVIADVARATPRQ